MARWKPDARQRLVVEALKLFAEQGFDETTVAQIAERAGLTRSTFHRHFADKRDILTAGQETLSRLLAEGIAEAPAGATPLDAVAAGLDRASSSMTEFNRELSPLIDAAIAANDEFRARNAMKAVGMAAAMDDALVARGVPGPVARLAAEMGVVAFSTGFRGWVDPAEGEEPGELRDRTAAAFAELREAAATLG
ncbi:TetR/AcrR family transcriptional regulator [Demequina soli]|uniref:TetR/AcrR family transcriptional regulator n=1 Tax=Demequina soli TaxID=1638987 RepID=UPI000783CE87|nr:TetR/AcrR family transcriptional regulator [Demequina soli]